jgi:FtsH-binding integral membrane protein
LLLRQVDLFDADETAAGIGRQYIPRRGMLMILFFLPSLLLSIVLSIVLTILLNIAIVPALLIAAFVFIAGLGLTRLRV